MLLATEHVAVELIGDTGAVIEQVPDTRAIVEGNLIVKEELDGIEWLGFNDI